MVPPYDYDPEYEYWQDGSYVEVTGSIPFPGKVNWASGDHSAITTAQSGILISKWNEYPLMKHAWDDSPYGTSNLKYYKLNFPITGPDIVCTSNSTFTLHGATSGSTVTWSVIHGNVSQYSGSGTSATFHSFCSPNHGNGKLTFTLSNPCGGTASYHVSKTFIAGGPDYNDVELDVYYSSGQQAPNENGTWLMCPNTTYHIYVVNNSICTTSNYSWTVPSGWTIYYTKI